MMTALDNIRLLLLGCWLGAAIFFSAVVAPSAFAVLRTFGLPNANEIAGTIVTRNLSVVNTSGFVISLLLLVIALALRQSYTRRTFILQICLLAIIAITTSVGEWIIAAKMRNLRAAMHLPIDQVALSDPSRIAFAALHGYSVAALAIGIIAGLIAFFVIASRTNLMDK
jgi:hypothetical protein